MLSLVPRFPWFARRKPSVHKASWVNTCELVRQVFMHINNHTSSQFSSVKVMTRFLPLDLSFMNSSISSSSSAAVFLVAVPDLSAMLYTQRRNPTRWKDNRGVLETDPSFDWLVTSTSMSCAMVLRGKTKMAHRFFYTLSRFGWSLFSVSNLF